VIKEGPLQGRRPSFPRSDDDIVCLLDLLQDQMLETSA